VILGDDDEVILEHAIELYRGLPDGELAVVPGTSHGPPVEKPTLCDTIIVDFLSADPVRTMAPIRRGTLPAGHAPAPAGFRAGARIRPGPGFASDRPAPPRGLS
jgi:hypothetical protein